MAGAPAPAGADAADGGDNSFTAMIASCGPAPCSPGQVAVEPPPNVANTGAAGVATGSVSTTPAGGPAAAPAPASTPVPADASAPASTLICAVPPPGCPAGQSPQFTTKHTWECTDCSLVVTYGGLYGNYRRCVNMPKLVCPTGDVPTWTFESEQWECQAKCDNGQYDQHTVEGILVCVPC